MDKLNHCSIVLDDIKNESYGTNFFFMITTQEHQCLFCSLVRHEEMKKGLTDVELLDQAWEQIEKSVTSWIDTLDTCSRLQERVCKKYVPRSLRNQPAKNDNVEEEKEDLVCFGCGQSVPDIRKHTSEY